MMDRRLLTIVALLVTIRYSIGFATSLIAENNITAIFKILVPIVSYILTSLALWLYKTNFQEMHIDKTSFIVFLLSCAYICWRYLFYYATGMLLLLIAGSLTLDYLRGDIKFHSTKHAGSVLGISLVAFIFTTLLFTGNRTNLNSEKLQNFIGSASILGVIFEEFLFRGLLWKLLKDMKINDYISLAIQGMLFWLAHFDLLFAGKLSFWTTLPVVSVIFGLLVYYTKSLTSSLVVHVSYNLLVSFIKQ